MVRCYAAFVLPAPRRDLQPPGTRQGEGSGEVESAHRYIPQKRMKIPGACWSPATINPMLALRVMRENDWWEPFWESEAPQDTV